MWSRYNGTWLYVLACVGLLPAPGAHPRFQVNGVGVGGVGRGWGATASPGLERRGGGIELVSYRCISYYHSACISNTIYFKQELNISFYILSPLCAGNSPVTSDADLWCILWSARLSKQWWGWWFGNWSKRRQTETSTHQNVDTPKHRQTETSTLHFIIFYAMV